MTSATPDAPDFRAICEAELPYVWSTLRRLGVREADRPDVAQEVFLVVHDILPDYDRARPLRPWLFGIAYRVALRANARAHHRRERYGVEVEPAAPTPGPDESLSQAQDRALVRAAVEQIEVRRRAVFILCDLDGHTVPDAATALSIPMNTAYSRLRRAREEFAVAVRALREEAR